MTKTIVKLGLKGQIVIKKELREKFGIKPGTYVETIVGREGILIRPVRVKEELESVSKLREKITKLWPKGLDSVNAVREHRE